MTLTSVFAADSLHSAPHSDWSRTLSTFVAASPTVTHIFGMARHFADSRTGANQVKKINRAFRRGRGRVAGLAHRTRRRWHSGGLGAGPGHGKIWRTGARSNCPRRCGQYLVSMDDPAYPSRLKEIYDPPLVLYVSWKSRGAHPDRGSPCGHEAPDALRIGNGGAAGV